MCIYMLYVASGLTLFMWYVFYANLNATALTNNNLSTSTVLFHLKLPVFLPHNSYLYMPYFIGYNYRLKNVIKTCSYLFYRMWPKSGINLLFKTDNLKKNHQNKTIRERRHMLPQWSKSCSWKQAFGWMLSLRYLLLIWCFETGHHTLAVVPLTFLYLSALTEGHKTHTHVIWIFQDGRSSVWNILCLRSNRNRADIQNKHM